MKLILAILCCILIWAACENDPPNHLKHDPNYTHVHVCPMDCEKGKTYQQPGECPVCHMKLRQKEVRMKDLNQGTAPRLKQPHFLEPQRPTHSSSHHLTF